MDYFRRHWKAVGQDRSGAWAQESGGGGGGTLRWGSILCREPLNPQEWATRPSELGGREAEGGGRSCRTINTGKPRERKVWRGGQDNQTETEMHADAQSDIKSWEAPIACLVVQRWLLSLPLVSELLQGVGLWGLCPQQRPSGSLGQVYQMDGWMDGWSRHQKADDWDVTGLKGWEWEGIAEQPLRESRQEAGTDAGGWQERVESEMSWAPGCEAQVVVTLSSNESWERNTLAAGRWSTGFERRGAESVPGGGEWVESWLQEDAGVSVQRRTLWTHPGSEQKVGEGKIDPRNWWGHEDYQNHHWLFCGHHAYGCSDAGHFLQDEEAAPPAKPSRPNKDCWNH